MDAERMSSFDAVMSAVAASAESIASLPAVATLEWCDRAAWCLAGLVEPALATLTIGTLSPTTVTVRIGIDVTTMDPFSPLDTPTGR